MKAPPVAATLALIAAAATAQPFAFEEIAAAAGVDFVHRRAITTDLWFPEIMSGGGGWLDYDGDGDLDLYLVQGGELDPDAPPGPGDRLYRNDGDLFVDVTEHAIPAMTGYGMGLAVGDYDGDGDADVYVTQVGPNVLLSNAGDGTFVDVTETAGVGHPGWGTSAAFVDYDADGHADLFVVNYIHWSPDSEIDCYSGGRSRDYCHPSNYNSPAADVLYRNRGDGSFQDVTTASGIGAYFGNGLGVAVADFDADGRPDLYVANDGMPNQLWLNRGERFVNEALMAGCAVNRAGAAEAGMGVVAADLDRDLRPDLFVTHLRDETNTLYLNRGGWFEDAGAARGLGGPSIGLTGFGTGAADFDHDGEVDLLVVNGKVGRGESRDQCVDPFGEPDQLFRGTGGGHFALAPIPALAESRGASRAAAFGDADGDGDIDVLIVDNGGPARLLRNGASADGWMRIQPIDARGHAATGVEVEILAGGARRRARAERAYSYCASNDPAVHFGLGSEVVGEATLVWPGGTRQRWLAPPRARTIVAYPR